MSNHLPKHEADWQPPTPRKRRRALWVATGVAGLTGVLGLATVGVVVGREDTNGETGVERLSATQPALVADDKKTDRQEDGAKGNENAGKGEEGKGQEGKGQEGKGQEGKGQEEARGQEEGRGPEEGKGPDGKDDKNGPSGDADARGDLGSEMDGQGAPWAGKGWNGRGWDGKEGDDESWDGRDWDGKNHDGKEHQVEEVGCDPDKLIAAITRANANNGASLKLAEGCTYTLTANQDGNGLPVITESITIKGEDSKIVRAANADLFRIFNVGSGGHLTLHGLTILGGQTAANGTADGGAILVQAGGTAAINHSTITRNISGDDGGGIRNAGTTFLNGSTVSDNSAWDDGGGIHNTGLLKVNESVIGHNSAEGDGGGIADDGTSLISRSRIIHNRSFAFGGGIFSDSGAITTVAHSFLGGNTGATGGGFYSTGATVHLRHVTVYRNRADGSGAGVTFDNGSQVTVENSSITKNTAGNNAGGIYSLNSTLVVRNSDVTDNLAIGPASNAGGIRIDGGTVALHNTTVSGNLSSFEPGGVRVSGGATITVDDETTITGNRPTNCVGSPQTVPNCFG